MILNLPPPLDGDLVLEALATVETDAGRNNWPNFEPAYAPAGARFTIEGRLVVGTGLYYRAQLPEMWQRYGMAAASSFGRWQLLAAVAWERGFRGHPALMWADETVGRELAEKQLEWICTRFNVMDLRDIADAWNSGNPRDARRVPEYTVKVLAAYDRLRAGARA